MVDCVVGDQEQCDATGTWIRNHARDAVCGGRCGAACSCRKVQIRLTVRKMKSQFRSQWGRVEAAFKMRCLTLDDYMYAFDCDRSFIKC